MPSRLNVPQPEASVLSQFSEHIQHGLVLWCDQPTQPVPSLTVEKVYRALETLQTQDKVRYTLLNEFGPSFDQHPSYSGLMKRVIGRLTASNQ